MKNHNVSLDLSKPTEAMAWLVVFRVRARSEKKLTRLQMEQIPQTFEVRTSSSANLECSKQL